jgi:hypothetical protein
MSVASLLTRSTPNEQGCWIWQGAITAGGYAEARFDGGVRLVHRVLYEALVRPLKQGETIDHLCRVRHCVNPGHMDPVPIRTNVLRGTGPSAVAAHRDHCAKGHPYPMGTYIHPSGSRRCRVCAHTWNRTSYLRRTGR